jgi:hypothetical protein
MLGLTPKTIPYLLSLALIFTALEASASNVVVSPTSITFPTTPVGDYSAAVKVTLTNNSGTSITLSTPALSTPGIFPVLTASTTCTNGLVVANLGTCIIEIRFKPKAVGSASGTLKVFDSDSSSPQTVALQGTGTNVDLSPASINFGTIDIGSESADSSITLTNNTGASITLSTPAVSISGPFVVGGAGTTCTSGLVVASLGTCIVEVRFKPKAAGSASGTLKVFDSDSTSPQTVALQGIGTNVDLSPTSINFGTIAIGYHSSAHAVTLTNNTGASLTLSTPSFSISGRFVEDVAATTCTNGLVVANLGTCIIEIRFKPNAVGPTSGTLKVFDSDPTSPQSVALQGTGKVAPTLSGEVLSGLTPVSNSTVQIYEVSAVGAGYGAAAQPVQQNGAVVTATTNSTGDWSYPAFTCVRGVDELYVVADGGNPGLASGTNNTALTLMAALGTCNAATSIPSVVINEVTTVATAYSLAGFMTDLLHVGTSSTNVVGLSNAFATFKNLANITNGTALTVTPAYATAPTDSSPDVFRSIVPYDTINTLADILFTCSSTNGTGVGCSNLFALTGSVTDTASAALYIAHNPGLPDGAESNVSAVYELLIPSSPFLPVLASAPNDFTLTLNFIGGGLGGVTAASRSGGQLIAIDENGNVWIPNSFRTSVTELSNLGAPLSPTTTTNQTAPYAPIALGGWGASSGVLAEPRMAAVDQNGNVWIADGLNCLVAFNSSGAPLSGAPFTGVCPSGTGAYGVSVDAGNQIWAAGSTFVTSASDSGVLSTGFPDTSNFDTLTGFLGADYSGHTWYLDGGNNQYGALNPNGTVFVTSTSLISGPDTFFSAFGSLSAAAGGNGGLSLWVPEGQGGTLNIQPINVTGAINTLPTAFLPGTEVSPQGIAADGNSNYFLANEGGSNGVSILPANLTVMNSSGSVISPPTSGYIGGSQLTVLGVPVGVAIDQAGNVWVVNLDNDNPPAPGQFSAAGSPGHTNVTEFVGLAAPVNPVFSVAAKNGDYATKP